VQQNNPQKKIHFGMREKETKLQTLLSETSSVIPSICRTSDHQAISNAFTLFIHRGWDEYRSSFLSNSGEEKTLIWRSWGKPYSREQGFGVAETIYLKGCS
jgi:hypothetical protein